MEILQNHKCNKYGEKMIRCIIGLDKLDCQKYVDRGVYIYFGHGVYKVLNHTGR